MKKLVATCFGDKEKAIRLIEYERRCDPTLKTLEATEMALDRLCYDRGKAKRAPVESYSRGTAQASSNSNRFEAAKDRQGPPDMNVRMVLSALLACAIVLGFGIVASRSMKKPALPRVQAAVPMLPTLIQPPQAATVEAPAPAASDANASESNRSSSVFKCVVNGHTVYSDAACGTAATAKRLVLVDSAGGFARAPKERLEELTARRVASEQAYQRTVQAELVQYDADTRKAECDRLNQHVERLDSLARLPQSAHGQDWIRAEKVRAQSRQYDLQC